MRLGRHRWKAERTIAWLAGCRRVRVRYDRDSERCFAFAVLGCARLCYNRWVSTVSDPQRPRSPPTSRFRNVLLGIETVLALDEQGQQIARFPLVP
jgi:hypothetical protein